MISVTAFIIANKKTASLSLRLKQFKQYFRNFPFFI
nr:MAG TPA: hypothetical protein [Caudoviricetes sp.]